MNNSPICRSEELAEALRASRPDVFAPDARKVPEAPGLVSILYILPKGAAERPEAPGAIKNAGLHLQTWLARQLGGKSFHLLNPSVLTVRTSQTADWFREEPNGSDLRLYFWFNVEKVMKASGHGGFGHPSRRFVYYIEADPAPDQLVGGAAGVALLPRADVDGLLGLSAEPVCRWVGGLGHELGHALELPHPPGCDTNSAEDPRQCESLMYSGYANYPKTFLVPEDHKRLAQSSFISAFSGGVSFDCSDLRGAPAASLIT